MSLLSDVEGPEGRLDTRRWVALRAEKLLDAVPRQAHPRRLDVFVLVRGWRPHGGLVVLLELQLNEEE